MDCERSFVHRAHQSLKDCIKRLAWLSIFVISGFLFSQQAAPKPAEIPGEDYIIGQQDVIEIKIWDNPDLSGKAVVSLDGHVNYHLIGNVKLAGLTTGQAATKLTELLSKGYVNNPQVTVDVVEYHSQKVFVSGEVAQPGTYYLTKKTQIVEAVAKAGGQTKDADREIIVVRLKRDGKTGKENKEILKIDFRSALEGDVVQNIYVENNDSIFVPRTKIFFILGEVKNPGKYNLEKDTTVMKALSLAGGETSKAAIGRTKVIRNTNSDKIEKKIDLNDTVQAGDIIIVPESFF